MRFQRLFLLAIPCCLLINSALQAQPLRPNPQLPPTPDPGASVAPGTLVPGARAPGVAAPGYLGLNADTVVRGTGVEVLEVEPGGPAAKASVRVGDVIQRVNGRSVQQVEDLGRQLAGLRAGESVRFEVRRGLTLLELTAKLAARPAADTPAEATPATGAPAALLGVVTLPVDAVTAARLGLPVQRGALVDQVVPGTPAATARIPVGAVIVAVDETRVESPEGLKAAVSRRGPGRGVTIQYYEGTAMRGVRIQLAESVTTQKPSAADDDVRATLREELRTMKRQLTTMQERIEQLERLLDR